VTAEALVAFGTFAGVAIEFVIERFEAAAEHGRG
jgi:hypothetical protein